MGRKNGRLRLCEMERVFGARCWILKRVEVLLSLLERRYQEYVRTGLGYFPILMRVNKGDITGSWVVLPKTPPKNHQADTFAQRRSM